MMVYPEQKISNYLGTRLYVPINKNLQTTSWFYIANALKYVAKKKLQQNYNNFTQKC
jgi:hypothetical protein